MDYSQQLLNYKWSLPAALQGKVIPFNLPETGEGIQTVEIREW